MIPQLRFPGFSGEWQVKKLGDIAELTSSKRVYLSDYELSGIPFYRGKEISELKLNIVPDDILYISNNAYDRFKNKFGAPKKNEILITAVGTLGNILRIKNNEPFYFKDGNLIWLKNIREEPYFLEILLETEKNKLLRSAIGSSQKALTIVGLNKLKFSLPNEAEQQKIADFLTAVDGRVAVQQQKVELLKKYKRGVIQKIFTQQIRFRDENGDPYPDWQEKKLGEIFEEVSNGLNIDQNSKREGVRVTRIETISNDNINLDKVGYVDTAQNLDGYKLYEGDMLFSNINSPAQIGRLVYVDKNYDLYHGMNLLKLKINSSNNSKYLYYVLSSYNYKRYFETICNKAVNQASINQTDLKKTKITVPNKYEQQKIANFLVALDDKIKLEEAKLKKAKLFKKSLLQRMFV